MNKTRMKRGCLLGLTFRDSHALPTVNRAKNKQTKLYSNKEHSTGEISL